MTIGTIRVYMKITTIDPNRVGWNWHWKCRRHGKAFPRNETASREEKDWKQYQDETLIFIQWGLLFIRVFPGDIFH
jgi:hypothetical protein